MSFSAAFRAARSEDLEILLDQVRDFHAHERLSYDRQKVAKILSALLADPALGQLWIAEVGGKIAGYAVLGYGYSIEYGGRDAFLDELYLAPEFRGKGVGMAFLKQIENSAKCAGVSVIHLEVENDNQRAFDVYRAYGFKPKSRRMMSLWMDSSQRGGGA